jgi:hypothetical protein
VWGSGPVVVVVGGKKTMDCDTSRLRVRPCPCARVGTWFVVVRSKKIKPRKSEAGQCVALAVLVVVGVAVTTTTAGFVSNAHGGREVGMGGEKQQQHHPR